MTRTATKTRRTRTVLALQWYNSTGYSYEHGWQTSGHKYGSKGAFTRDWKGGRGFISGLTKPARLVNVASGEVVWESDIKPS